MAKRANGEGCIDSFRGKWRVRVVIEAKRKQWGPLYDTKEGAQAALSAFLHTRDGYHASSEITLAAFGADWFIARAKDGSRFRERVRSLDTELSAWNRHVAGSELAAKPITNITPKDVEAFTRALRDKPAVHTIVRGPITARILEHRETGVSLSTSSQKHVIRLLRAVLDAAIIEAIITTNPASQARPKPGGRRPRDLTDDWLRAAEIEQLFTCRAIAEQNIAAYVVAIGTALRKGDLRLLEVSQVHLAADPFPVVRVWLSKPQKWHPIPLMPWFAEALRHWMARLPQGARYVFSPDADHMTPYAPGHSFRWPDKPSSRGHSPSALDRAGVKRRVRFHDLRGTTATHLALGTWGRKWSLHEIQGMLAHSDAAVTQRYVRRAEDMLATAARESTGGAVGSRWSQILGVSATPPVGIEPTTFRLEDASIPLTVRGVGPSWNQRVTHLLQRAELAGDPAFRAEVLALAVEHPAIAAFLEVQRAPDGELAIRRTLALLDTLGQRQFGSGAVVSEA